MEVIITGGTGFIGSHLVRSLLASSQISSVRILVRTPCMKEEFGLSDKLALVNGDILDSESLKELIVQNSVVVNLAYLDKVPPNQNLKLIDNLTKVCQEKKIKRLIHCSTAVVSGRTKESLLNEDSVPNPVSEYERTKLMLEERIFANTSGFESIILRPSAVFGPGGQNLIQLANQLRFGSVFKNYLRSCLYGTRTMNLVSVENVVSAIRFLILREQKFTRKIYIVADDENPNNNYISVEAAFMEILGVKNYPLRRILLPTFVLPLFLRILKKSNIDIHRRYSCRNLEQLGWHKQADFDTAINNFALWLNNQYSSTTVK